jgi:hypothetical protein
MNAETASEALNYYRALVRQLCDRVVVFNDLGATVSLGALQRLADDEADAQRESLAEGKVQTPPRGVKRPED